MNKKIIRIVLIILILSIFLSADIYGAQYNRLFVNNELMPVSQNTYMEDYRNYISQDVLEHDFGFRIWENPELNTIYIYKNKNLITAAGDEICLNWKHIKVDGLPKTIENKLFIPISIVRILHDVPVIWNDKYRFIRIPTVSQAVYESVCNVVYSQVEYEILEHYKAELNESLRRSHKAISIDGIYPPENPKKFAYLTFDDGPSPEVTPAILDVLKQYGIKATFFMQGTYINDHLRLAQRVYLEGHTIGNHSYTHKLKNLTSILKFKEETIKTNELIMKISGSYPYLFRPPYGIRMTGSYLEFLRSKSLRIIKWNVESGDSRGKTVTSNKIYQNVADSLNTSKDVVIILHDGPGHIETANALRNIIKVLWEKKFGILPITESTKINGSAELK